MLVLAAASWASPADASAVGGASLQDASASFGLGALAGSMGSFGGPRASNAGLARAYGRLPLSFVANRGQANRRVRFLARTAGSAMLLTRRGAVISMVPNHRGGKGAALSLRFAGARPRPAVTGRVRQAGTVNYLTGDDRADWRMGIPTFARVAYRDVWPGIDAVFYGRRGRLEYDLRLSPGADPDRIALQVDGARSMRVTRGGALAMRVPGGTVRQLAPHAYQRVDGERRAVAARYLLRGGRVHIRVGDYDRGRPLVVDPAVAYSTYLGGGDQDINTGVAVDAQGAAYVTGSTESTDFPTAHALPGLPEQPDGSLGPHRCLRCQAQPRRPPPGVRHLSGRNGQRGRRGDRGRRPGRRLPHRHHELGRLPHPQRRAAHQCRRR